MQVMRINVSTSVLADGDTVVGLEEGDVVVGELLGLADGDTVVGDAVGVEVGAEVGANVIGARNFLPFPPGHVYISGQDETVHVLPPELWQ